MGGTRVHHTPTSSKRWSGATNEARLSTEAGPRVLRQAFAWLDPDADPDTKAAYKFIHHEVSADGRVGAASERACISGIAVLNGGRGGADVPPEDRHAIYRHLAAHLQDAGREPAPLKDARTLRRGGRGGGRSREARS